MVIGKEVSTKLFFYDKDRKSFSQEASTLQGSGVPGKVLFGQLYDDAADEGFVLVSHKTGKGVPFHFSNVEVDGEGEVLAWHFKSAANRYAPESKLSLTVWND